MALTITKFAHLKIPLEDVVKATDNFADANIIGTGGYGPAYKGRLFWSGNVIKIAALRLDRKHGQLGDFEFLTEISILSDLNHTNLVSIVGFCDEKGEKIIVIKHEANGSLEEHLKNPNLTWTQRLRISVDVARALSYLHHEKGRGYGVIHRNINTSTILLDENWEAKLSGFVFSIKQLVSRKEQAVLCEPVATIGYVDPAIEKIGGASSKSDIYSFGVVLFEILCGRSAFIENEDKRFLAPLAKYHYENNTLEDIIHPNLCNQIFARSLLKYASIAYSCLNEEPAHRPNMAYVVVKLEKAMELQLRGENLWKNSKHLKIQLNDIIIATNNFSHIYRTEIGDFNSWYKADLDHCNNDKPPFVDEKCKGELLKTHNTVIIKRFYPKDEEEEDLALREIEMLASVKHPNIVTLIGFCVEGSEIIRVIENASNGYLSDYLESKCFFNWEKRLKICVDVAKALNYLHFEMEDQKAMVHGDIRIYNIRLFENWRAKIDEFEEAVLLPVNQEHEARHKDATIYNNFYTDPEYMNTGKYKRELDVYSFGVLLFEMLCGSIANDPTYMKESDIGLVHVVRQSFCMKTLEDMIDPIIKEGSVDDNFVLHKGPNKDSLNTFIEIAYQCVATTQDQRPTMKVVLKELEKALFLQENIENLKLSLEDVKLATQNFHDDNCIGRGSFGKVYTGKVARCDGFNTIVAMRFDARLGQGVQQFVNELQMLLEYKHDNIIRLVGYCDEMNDKVIVYESLSKSLDRHLNDVSLTWKKRLNICIDVASALDFLHGGVGREAKVVIHKDIKSANILLNDSWKAKLASFGPFLISPINQEPGYDVCGTPGYLDPMYIGSGFLSKESDIYSFGVVLFEILCGRSTLAFHQHEGCYLEDYIKNNFGEGKQEEVVFEQIKEQIVPESLVNFQTIAYQCLHHEREKRPTAKKVLIQLKKALELQEKGVQDLNTDEDVNKLEKLQLTPEIHGMNLEHLKIHLSEIESATRYFSEIHKIAHFDCIWYRAELDHPKGRGTVVIKRYPTLYVYGEEEFFTEIKVLTNVQHPNIITLLGFCDEGSEMILVTENVSNGYLFNYLGNVDAMSVLTWEKRLQICIDVAHALNYLHYEIEDQTVIINRDIASSNIGLDENWSAKILEFGVSVFPPLNQEDEGIYLECRYRPTYVDPEIKTVIRYKRESDIYSFGVVMFELLCGRKADDPFYMKKNERGLAPLARHSVYMGTLEDMIDPILKEETSENNFFLNRGPNKDSLRTFIEIAYQCVAETQNQRPTIKAVIQELENALLLEKTNKDNPKVPLGYVKLATQDFHYDNCIGIGGFGKVYKGCVQDGDEFNTIVAKRLDTRFGQGEKQFLIELQILLEYKHENIIGLLGYCDENDEKILIYEYASRGSLDRYLNDASLTWVKRLNICIEVASALCFLHEGVGRRAKVIHRDIKTANILLNHDWKAKLGDFGLSLISPLVQEKDFVMDHACGTPGYLDPLYNKLRFLTIESDIYSFGVVLFEILCGRSTFAIHKHEGHYLPSFIKNKFENGKQDEVVFEQIKEEIVSKSLTTFQDIAYQCLHYEREKRPETKKVLSHLKKALAFQNMASTMTKFAALQIPLEDIAKGTNNFDDDNIIGHGIFCTTYKGRLLRFGKLMKIAARRFDNKHGERDLQFMTEISVLYDLKHTNVVSIIGFCDEKDEKIIVAAYEAVNGSLGEYLNSHDLTWMQRLKISLGVARALSYLYHDKERDYAIIHCNINSDTILLDENWEPKLSGFEIAIKQSACHKDQGCFCEHVGTMGCMDPAIKKTGGVTHKSDIYSFGVVLFEILCGRKAVIGDRFLAPLARYHYENKTLHDITDIDLLMSPISFVKYSDVAYSCLNEDQTHRPNVNYIVDELEKALELEQQYENVRKKLVRLKRRHLKFRLTDIKFATDNFSETHKIFSLFNYNCYRAELLQHGKQNASTVVIKRISSRQELYQELHFVTDFEVLTHVNHPNIVTLFGFCIEADEMILCFDNVSKGYLANYLSSNEERLVLTWEKRLKICIDVARALNYLHDQKMIINRDICAWNIGLDENWGAKIVNFHFSTPVPSNQEDGDNLNWMGRTCYRDPEYEENGMLKKESDVYSFGVVLFEVLCGRLADDPIYTKENERGLAHLARHNFYNGTQEDMIDPIIMKETKENNTDSLSIFIDIANQCMAETQDQRPTMKVVVDELEKALFFFK